MNLRNRFGVLVVAASAAALAAGLISLDARSAAPGAAAVLRIYFVDVEGGQATLIVAPAGASAQAGRALLVDTGWPDANGCDAKRIVAAAKKAGVSRLDFLLITHFHMDHVGGVTELVRRIPVETFLDHGANVETGKEADGLFKAYEKAAATRSRRTVKPGDSLALGDAEVKVLTADGDAMRSPLPGAGLPNAACQGVKPMEDDPSENARSVGILVTYGKFRFVDFGDLTWNKELALMCPENPIGAVNVFLVSHHGMNISNSPALVWALAPRVAIMNNGEKKGGSPEAWETVEKSPGLESLWQLHYSAAGGKAANVANKYIANPRGTDRGFGIELAAEPDGSFTLTNSRTGFKKKYPAR
ncbi:MAG: MBL fold metallo-hydrolase [Acidobacteria bacterium]|nr:MAG: MBL fold metallo-hydrolase [Acidobacteriota bacterium]